LNRNASPPAEQNEARSGSMFERATQESEMAEVIERDVAVGSDGAIVERKVVPHRRAISPFGAFLVVAFVATCAVVFFGNRLGLGTPPIGSPQVTNSAPAPTPPPTTP
jgi:hypothetical protein